MRRSDKPYRFRQCKGRAISVEFSFIPGKRISTGCYDMPSAVLWAEEYLRNAGVVQKTIPTLSVFARDFFVRTDPQSFQARQKAFGHEYSWRYYRDKQGHLDNYILPAFGGYLVTALTMRMIEDFIVGVGRKNGKALANDTKNKILVSFRFIMEDVKRCGYRSDNPAEEVRMLADNSEERDVLRPDELAVLFPPDPDKRIEIWGSTMWALYFSIFYDTGMRPGEIAALRVCDIWKTKNGIAVGTDRGVDTQERRVVSRVKTSGNGLPNRGGLLYWDTAEILIRHIEEKGLHGEDLLFTTSKVGVLTTATSLKHFKTVLSRNGIELRKGLVQYSMRHSYETYRRGDMPDEILAASMGHTRLRNDYDHQTVPDLLRRLDGSRDAFFENRERLGRADADIIPFEEAIRKGRR